VTNCLDIESKGKFFENTNPRPPIAKYLRLQWNQETCDLSTENSNVLSNSFTVPHYWMLSSASCLFFMTLKFILHSQHGESWD
jgi:hypothetical protein